MKKFFEVAMNLKERVGLIYTGAMCFYMFFLWVFKQDSAPLPILFSLLVVSVAASAMQVLAFSDLVIKKLSYGWRMLVFIIPFGAILTAAAVACGWFPTDQIGAWVLFGASFVGFGWFPVENAWAWVSFGVTFLLIFAAITAGIEIYYRASGRRWDDRLDWYKKNRDKE